MENRVDNPFQDFIQKTTRMIYPNNIQPFAPSTVMPLYQIIRFANQAAEKKQTVYIEIEKQLPNGNYTSSKVKGVFRSGVNSNRQIAFVSHSDAMLYLLKIEQILSIQLAA